MKCIFCLEERTPTVEHIFPLAIGGSLTTDRVCQSCNSALGTSADGPLVKHPLVLMKRQQLRISDRSGKIPDALGEFVKEGTLAEDSSKKFRISTDQDQGIAKVELLYGEKEIVLPDGSKAKQVAVDASDTERAKKQLRRIIQRERERNGLPALPSEELERHVAEVMKQEPQNLESPTIISTVELDMFGLRLGLLKIAYELAFLWLGESYLDDPIAAQIRTVLLMTSSREDAITAAESIRAVMSPHCDYPLRGFMPWDDNPNSHVAFSGMTNGSILIFVRVFTAVAGVVVVSDNASRYAKGPYDPNVIRLIRLDPIGGESRDTSFTDEIGRLYLSRFAVALRRD